MLPDRVSNPGPLTYESGVLPIALRGPALSMNTGIFNNNTDIRKCQSFCTTMTTLLTTTGL